MNGNDKSNMSNNGISEISYQGFMRGVVKRRDDPTGEGRVAVYIPKLMQFQSTGAKAKEGKATNGSANYAETSEIKDNKVVNSQNYIWCRPAEYFQDGYESETNGTYIVPQLEQTVYVMFEDEDPQKPYYLPFGPSKKGQVIPMSNMAASESTKADPSLKPNLHILSELPNGNIIGFDYNETVNSFVVRFQNGHMLRIMKGEEGNKIELVTENQNLIEIDDNSDNININVNNDMNQEIGNNLTINVSNQANVTVGKNASIKAGSQIDMQAGKTINLKAGSSINLKAPKINKGR